MVLLVDEAHNLVERGREMYSARLVKEDFLAVKKIANIDFFIILGEQLLQTEKNGARTTVLAPLCL